MPPKNNNKQQQQGGRHTIVLMQPTSDTSSRTYADYNSVTEAINALIRTFEDREKAKAKSSGKRDVEYTSGQLLGFFDAMHDLSMLCFDQGTRAYVPFDRKFIKDKVYQMISKQ